VPLMVGNIVLLNSGSPPMTVKTITHAGQVVLCQWFDSGGVLHEMEFAPEIRKSLKPHDETKGPRMRNRIDRGGLDENAGQEFRRSPLPIFA
jgi:uncharacterized protein YodC (DUF2158 family)